MLAEFLTAVALLVVATDLWWMVAGSGAAIGSLGFEVVFGLFVSELSMLMELAALG